LHRSHESSDPLACLTLVHDDCSGLIAITGGHDDVVFAYGINSACALTSLYSNRDAITGICLVPRSNGHVMTTCSLDATVKLWSVTIQRDEKVRIDREPLVELFDAESALECVTTIHMEPIGFVIAAGCSDGTFVIWVWNDTLGKQVIYKEDARRGHGPCAELKWTIDDSSGETFLYAGFGNGRVGSYVLRNEQIIAVSKLHLGSPVQCLSVVDGDVFAGCADGGLRVLPVGKGGNFDYNPRTWMAVNGPSSPGITSLSVVRQNDTDGGKSFMCVTGCEDGTAALLEINQLR